jgi:hypothetical protein
MSTALGSRRFKVGLSFPGEVRVFARELDAELAEYFGKDCVFFDERYEHELSGVDLDLKLRKIYREECDLVVPIFCRHYEKPWCRLEWSAIRELMLECRNEDRIVPLALDDTEIPGWERTDLSIQRRDRSVLALAEKLRMAHEYRFPVAQLEAGQAGAVVAAASDNQQVELRNITEDQLQAADLRASVKKLRTSVVALFASEIMRKLVLKSSGLNENLTADTLVEEIFAVRPLIRESGRPHTPLCFVHRCIVDLTNKPLVESAIIDGLESLASLLLPLSIEDRHQSAGLRCAKAALHTVGGTDKVIGASIVGRLLGLRVALDANGTQMLSSAIHPNAEKDAIAIAGITANDLLAAIRTMLRGILNARSESITDIRAALRVWAARKAYVCVWVMSDPGAEQMKALAREMPLLIVLQGDGEDTSEVNAHVMYQLQEIGQFISSRRGQRT